MSGMPTTPLQRWTGDLVTSVANGIAKKQLTSEAAPVAEAIKGDLTEQFSVDKWFADNANNGSVSQGVIKRIVDDAVLNQSTIDYKKEIERMYEEEKAFTYERKSTSGFKQLQQVILDYLAKHPDGLMVVELQKLFRGAAIALGHDEDSVGSAVRQLQLQDKVFTIEEDFEWPPGSGWSSKVERVRPTFDAWVKAVG